MTNAGAMLDTYPKQRDGFDRDLLAECIEACFACAQTCTACADACLAEDMVAELRACIRLNLDCADICDSTGRVLSRQTDYNSTISRTVLEACRAACRACGDECTEHAEMHEHCRICAEACRRCEQACDALLSSMG